MKTVCLAHLSDISRYLLVFMKKMRVAEKLIPAIGLLLAPGHVVKAQSNDIQELGYIAPPDSLVEVDANLYINKIYNVNSVEETYQIDGYLEFQWIDERLAFESESADSYLIFENDRASEVMKSEVWVPAFEFVNIQGKQDTQHFLISIEPNGTVTYEERFFGIFHTEMNFRKFPFDYKKFVVEIEPFSYDENFLKFKTLSLFPDTSDTCKALDTTLGKDWNLTGIKVVTDTSSYGLPDAMTSGSDGGIYSKAVFEVHAKRISDYFIWQVLLPLFLIIAASFTIFWIRDFGTQIGIGFSLMLTVVAFNFYSASILPRLPYNTFIEYVIMFGYLFILFGIIAATINHNLEKREQSSFDLFKVCRWGFPASYLLIMIILILVNLVFETGTMDLVNNCG
ncbi:hypothetical protein [Rhodohalobacter sp. 8-1]|uniref:hypothetical protein n=1 Tax=Rhodohalobacter sp. 8-1 TaxID=3131972 RepID=UPI0030EE9315